MSKYNDLLKGKMSEESWKRLEALNNEKVLDFIGEYTEHCNPASIYVCDDSAESEEYVKAAAIKNGEEHHLANSEQTIHWDGYNDQARDKVNTRYMVYPENLEAMKAMNSLPYDEAKKEIMDIAKNAMDGKEAYVKFFTEGPGDSIFTVPCVQMTDSSYVLHSETILYRPGYAHFLKQQGCKDFFRFIHSAGKLDEKGNSVNTDKRRIYMDTQNNIVYSMNAQYAGNSVGMKKHSMRLSINKAGKEGWLCEHMFLMACMGTGKNKGRKTYFAGAYPSGCGKTSTAMIPGEEIVGDDITYFRDLDGEFRGVNFEQGIFGIIKDVNAKDDPVIYENLMKNQEVIFSNVLVSDDKKPYWLGMGDVKVPDHGRNHHGEWKAGDKDENGKEIGIAHANARYTMRLSYLNNFDKEGFENKEGVSVQGILYGGRDSSISVPCEESPSWRDGILLKAATLESETTAQTIGQEGVLKPSPMANMDFVSYPLGAYTMNNIKFGEKIKNCPKIFSTNYFLKGPKGEFLTSKLAKKIWLHWAEGRIHGEYDALETPTGKIPLYKDVKALFDEFLPTETISEETYTYMFTFRTQKFIDKLARTKKFYADKDPNVPAEIEQYWTDKIKELEAVKAKYGDEIKPGEYKGL
jgi:phosphoenolpyruvate carboxykinase (GTP)